MGSCTWQPQVALGRFTTLQAGGAAEYLTVAYTADELAAACSDGKEQGGPVTLLGMGSNVLISDAGLPGYTVINAARRISVARSGEVLAETGCLLQDLFLLTLQSGLRGLEFAVGIPGTLGGALASNAGAYRSAVSEFITECEVVYQGVRQWVPPEWMHFQYRDSRLRGPEGRDIAVLRVRMKMPSGPKWEGYQEARDYQRQRISKQPPQASAGSFFKNIHSQDVANRIPSLPPALKEKGIVPAGFVIEAVGLKGVLFGRSAFGARHANFLLNLGGSSATELRTLAEVAKRRVFESFSVKLEEEVLFLGDWSAFKPVEPL